MATIAAAQQKKETITFAGAQRTYYTYVPEKLAAPAPLLLLLHGSGRDGRSQIDAWKALAEKGGILLVAPDSANSRHWVFSTDGPEFLHEVIEAVRVTEMEGHDHDYYAVAPELNQQIWKFLSANKLAEAPDWQNETGK